MAQRRASVCAPAHRKRETTATRGRPTGRQVQGAHDGPWTPSQGSGTRTTIGFAAPGSSLQTLRKPPAPRFDSGRTARDQCLRQSSLVVASAAPCKCRAKNGCIARPSGEICYSFSSALRVPGSGCDAPFAAGAAQPSNLASNPSLKRTAYGLRLAVSMDWPTDSGALRTLPGSRAYATSWGIKETPLHLPLAGTTAPGGNAMPARHRA